jgi:hypothetical protein
MNRLRLRLDGLGPWLPALLLLGLAAALQGGAVPLLQQQTQDDEQTALRRLQARAAAATAGAGPAWQAALPAAAQRETRLADLLEAAARSGIQVQAVDQAPARDAAAGITQQRIDLSARGRYLDVRRFIEMALGADSGLALEHVSLLRQQADAAEVEARLQLSLVERADEASAPAPGNAANAAAVTRGAWHAPSAEAVAAWSAPQPVAVAAPARVAPRAVAAAPPSAPPPPPAPRAPGLGYELIGTVTDSAGAGALLASAQRSLWVRAGDTVDSSWRVQRVDASGVDLLWLPQQLPARLAYRTP